jgi:c(7)-type cytochrome triheme protein
MKAFRIKITIAASVILILILSAFSNNTSAIQIGKTIEYKDGEMGKVIFDGTKHYNAGYHCMKCHNKYFIPKTGTARMTYSEHSARKEYCFGCHDGREAFDVGNCSFCHNKSQ